MQEDNIAVRLKFLIQELGITNSVFAENCGISRATLSQLLTGRNKKISDIIISQIHSAYPSLSILWLLFNEGEMWITSDSGAYAASGSIDTGPRSGNSSENNNSLSSSSLFNNNGQGNVNFPSENLEFLPSDHAVSENAKENGLNSPSKPIQESINKQINNCLKSSDFLNEIENLRRKNRKVVQITVYYDDFTFESFFPASSSSQGRTK